MSGVPPAVVLFGAGGMVGRALVGDFQSAGIVVHAVTARGRPIPGCAMTVTPDALHTLPPLPAGTVVVTVASYRYDAGTFRADQPLILSQNAAITDCVYRFSLDRGITEVRAAGSVAVYPASWDVLDDERPLDLNAPVHAGEAAYAWSKRWAEIVADVYRQQQGINTITFRLTNPYGPFDTLSESAAHVATAFAIRALSTAPTFRIQGNPDAERDFIYTGDVAAAFRASLECIGLHDAMNLAAGRTISIRELAATVMQAADSVRPIEVAQAAPGGVQVRKATASRLRQTFPALPPPTSLLDGMKATLSWYRDALVH